MKASVAIYSVYLIVTTIFAGIANRRGINLSTDCKVMYQNLFTLFLLQCIVSVFVVILLLRILKKCRTDIKSFIGIYNCYLFMFLIINVAITLNDQIMCDGGYYYFYINEIIIYPLINLVMIILFLVYEFKRQFPLIDPLLISTQE